MKTILTKIKYKGILFEYIQGFVSNRHYILPYINVKKHFIFELFNSYFNYRNSNLNVLLVSHLHYQFYYF